MRIPAPRETTVSSRSKSLAESALPVLALLFCVIAANVPFLNQAFHMDDGFYVLLAQNVAHSPWFPQDTPAYFEGRYAQDLASTEHPLPVTSYLLALAAHIGHGFSEVNLHSAFLVFPVILTCSMYFLARLFTRHPVLATLSLIFLPVVYVLSHTLMTDVPLLAVWVASAALFIHGVDSGKKPCIWLGAVAAALASFISYSGLCLVPLLSFYALLRKDRRALLVMLLLPAVLFGLWLALSYLHYQRLTLGQLLGYYFLVKRVLSLGILIKKSVYIVLALGGVTVFPLALIAAGRKTTLVPGLLLAAIAMWLTAALHYPPFERILFAVFFCAGFAMVNEIVRHLAASSHSRKGGSRAAEDDLFLGVWFVGMLVFCALVYMTGSARHLLPATPPLVLLLFRRLEGALSRRRLQWVATANLALGGSLALLLAAADYQFAQIYRDYSSTFQARFPNRLNRVWFTGEWGFRAYLERAGGEELGRRDARPRPGEFLIVPRLASPYHTLFADVLDLESLVLVAPARVAFDIPALPPDSFLVYTAGMPFPDKSDGMDLSVCFVSEDLERVLYSSRLLPAEGRRWGVQQIPLREIAGRRGSIVFSAEVGGSGNADADWLAIARARICERTAEGEIVLYDLRERFKEARIEARPGVEYHTAGNRPVFPLTVWLEQQPASVLRDSRNYRPALPVRMLDAGAHAGFWCMSWGMLPFSFAGKDAILETVRVYEIVREVDAYGESTPSWNSQ